MSDNLAASYLTARATDPDEADYQQRLAKAREEDKHSGWLESLKGFAGDVAHGLTDPEQTGRNVMVAAYDAVKNTVQTGLDVNRSVQQSMLDSMSGGEGKGPKVAPVKLEEIAPDFMAKANAMRDMAAYGSTGGDVFVQKSMQFAVPFMGAMKAMGAAEGAGVVANLSRAAAADAVTSFSVWDPHEGRFADLIQTVAPDLPVMGATIDYLASNPDDSDMEARFKNVLDSQLASAAFAGFVFTAGKTLKGLKSGELLGQLTAQGPVGRSAQRGIIRPDVVLGLNTELKLPKDPEFSTAVANTPGAAITEDGLLLSVARSQQPAQEGEAAIRTGVFYLPSGDSRMKYYRKADAGYGGPQKHDGETLVRAPLFVKGATGGKAPEAAYAQLHGKEAMKKLERDVSFVATDSLKHRDPELFRTQVRDLLERYGADGSMAWDIIAHSKKGNQLRYALQENIIAHAVRDSGHDAVVGYTRSKVGPVLSELFDVREQTYPSNALSPQIHQTFEGRQ